MALVAKPGCLFFMRSSQLSAFSSWFSIVSFQFLVLSSQCLRLTESSWLKADSCSLKFHLQKSFLTGSVRPNRGSWLLHVFRAPSGEPLAGTQTRWLLRWSRTTLLRERPDPLPWRKRRRRSPSEPVHRRRGQNCLG